METLLGIKAWRAVMALDFAFSRREVERVDWLIDQVERMTRVLEDECKDRKESGSGWCGKTCGDCPLKPWKKKKK